MHWLDRLLVTLNPRLLVTGTPWEHIWRDKELADFNRSARGFFVVAMAAYVGHYHFFDVPMNLQPPERWLQFRYGMTLICLVALAFYLSPLSKSKYFRLPLFIATSLFCYFQGKVFIWYPDSNYLYCFAFSFVGTIVMRTSVPISILIVVFFTTLQTPSLIIGGIELPFILSASAVVAVFVSMVRSSYVSEIRYFIASQENVSTQKKLIELNIEFADRMRAFVPKVIYSRLEHEMKDNSISTLQAIDNVLTPKKTEVACLFSDIRGYTQGSKDLDSYINKGVLPNVKACTDAIETNNGIPKKVGDRIFSYFDDNRNNINLLRCVRAGLQVARLNMDMNETKRHVQINRYILISVGEAVVGNLGGFDSSVEITALGSPVNFLSRLDDITKAPAMQSKIQSSDIVMCSDSKNLLSKMGLDLNFCEIDLDKEGISVRDFPEVKYIYSLQPSDYAFDLVEASYTYIEAQLSAENENEQTYV